LLTPPRWRGVEILDDPSVDPAVRLLSMGDVARSNRWLGGRRAASCELREVLRALPRTAPLTLLDVGTGLADIPHEASRAARMLGVGLTTIGLDGAPSILAEARRRTSFVVCASAFALPFANRSIDVVMCSQLLHHFAEEDAARVLRELDRVARRVVIVSDLRRSWIAATVVWLVSFPLGFHRVTRHDGFVSVLRGFTPRELRDLVGGSVATVPTVTRRLGFRITARWMSSAV
jgi:SAM-dependent methyltransferase